MEAVNDRKGNRRLLVVYELQGRLRAWENLEKLAKKRIEALNKEINNILMNKEETVPPIATQTFCERCD